MKLNFSKIVPTVLFVFAVAAPTGSSWAAVSAAEAAKLKSELTPVGAEKAGNKEGTIPAWTGGISPLVPQTSGRRSNPYAAEKPLLSITAQTADKYADKLTPGVLALFKKYPKTYRVDVYPTHRPAAMPQDFYDATYKSATTTKIVKEADGRVRLDGDSGGVPFPIPQEGVEVMFNQLTTYYPLLRATSSNYLIQADGKHVLVSTFTNDYLRFYKGDERVKDGQYYAVRSRTTNPPIRAGEQIVGHNFTDASKDSSWVYLPGQRRVRKLPNSCCDTPTPFSSGLSTFDEVALFYGSTHKFDWKLLGKREMYVPYNTNDYMTPLKDEEVLSQYHLNPDHIRWELHRVWVVEAELREGERHILPRSVYYVDEDTWGVLLADRFDAQGQLARSGYALFVVMTENSAVFSGSYGWYDMLSGAAYVGGVFNESAEQLKVLDTLPKSRLTSDAMAGEGVR